MPQMVGEVKIIFFGCSGLSECTFILYFENFLESDTMKCISLEYYGYAMELSTLSNHLQKRSTLYSVYYLNQTTLGPPICSIHFLLGSLTSLFLIL